jgi:S-DNA-T family DNA segregation ATPase FtsK/SpoIIIE
MSTDTINGNGRGPGESPAGLIPGQRTAPVEVTVTKLPAEPAASPEPSDAIPAGYGPDIEDAAPAEAASHRPASPGSPSVEPTTAPAAPSPRPRVARRVAAHPATTATARHAVYVATGARAARSARRDARGTGRHERMMRLAEAAGDHATALLWEERAASHRTQRHERRLAMRTHPAHVAKNTVVVAGLTVGGLLALGIVLAVTSKDARLAFVPLVDAFEVIRWLFEVIEVVWLPAVLLTPAAVVLSWWNRGRSHAELPPWLMTAEQRHNADDVPITPSIVVTALRDLGLTELRKAIKVMADGAAGMLSPIRIAGCGIELDVSLPSGVTTAEIQARRQKLAENLGRHRHELHISIPPAPRTVRLWVADSGALDLPLGPSPMVADETMSANYKTGRAPWGQDLRGDAAQVSLFQRHILVTGTSNQGKTASLRSLALWLALDPRVRFWLADFKGVGDWLMFEGLAEILIQGPTDRHVMEGTHMVEAGVVEMEKRGALMLELTEQGWTMDKILADKRFDPLVIIVDEAQVAYTSTAVGTDKMPYGGQRNTSRYFQAIKKIHDQGRAVSVTTAEGTQDPTDANLPKRTREGNHIRASLVVGTESQSKMALGEAAVDAGAAPHELRMGLDKGTLVVVGDGIPLAPGQSSITVRTHYIGPEDATALADRAKARRKGAGTKQAEAEPEKPRDVLADVAFVLGDAVRMLSEEVLHRLKNVAGSHYGSWSTTNLKAVLEPYGAEARPYNGRMNIARERVLEAIAERDAAAEPAASGQ